MCVYIIFIATTVVDGNGDGRLKKRAVNIRNRGRTGADPSALSLTSYQHCWLQNKIFFPEIVFVLPLFEFILFILLIDS